MGKKAPTPSALKNLGAWKAQGSHLQHTRQGVGEQVERKVSQV